MAQVMASRLPKDLAWWRRPLVQFSVVAILTLVAVAGGAVWASQRAGYREALVEARIVTAGTARTLILPQMSDELVQGDPDAIAEFDLVVRERLLDDSIVRVKLWNSSGMILYSDEPRLIGEIFESEAGHLEPLGQAVAESPEPGRLFQDDLAEPENRFERSLGPLLEVYLPFEGHDKETYLLEIYFTDRFVNEAAIRIRSTILPITLASLTAAGAFTMLLAVRLNRRMEQYLVERELLLVRAIDASAYERRRIAADLHDGVIQDVTGTLILMRAAQNAAGTKNELLTERLVKASDGLNHSLQSLRSLAIEINPPDMAEIGLTGALEDLAEKSRHRHALNIELEILDQIDDAEVQRLIFRFVNEGIRNVAKHADARSVHVRVEQTTQQITVSVDDDGRGYTASDHFDGEGMGLRLLSELAAEIEATVSLDDRPVRGSSLTLKVPR